VILKPLAGPAQGVPCAEFADQPVRPKLVSARPRPTTSQAVWHEFPTLAAMTWQDVPHRIISGRPKPRKCDQGATVTCGALWRRICSGKWSYAREKTCG
jgi:hypothetical protein